MSAYAHHVQRMTSGSAASRATALASLQENASLLRNAEGELLKLVREPGLLAALNTFLAGNGSEATTALNVLYTLATGQEQCMIAIFDSPCFPSLKNIAATGSSVQLRGWAFSVITWISFMEVGRLKALLDSPGMVALLQAGMKSADITTARHAICAVANLSADIATASAMLDSHPDLVQALVKSFSTDGVCDNFRRKSTYSRLHVLPSPAS